MFSRFVFPRTEHVVASATLGVDPMFYQGVRYKGQDFNGGIVNGGIVNGGIVNGGIVNGGIVVTETGALQKFLAIVLFCTFPISLFGADKAILNANGTATLVNGSRAQRSSALFAGDKVETAKDSVANINVLGSSVLVMPNSAVRFQGDSVAIDHGKISIVTSKGMVARTGDLTIAPAPEKASKFDVFEDEGTVLVAARKGNLTINDGKGTSVLQEGQQTTVDNSQDRNQPNNQKNRKRKTGGAVPAAAGGASVSGKTIETGALIAAGATGTAAAVLAIVTTGTPNNCSVSPVSPAQNGCK